MEASTHDIIKRDGYCPNTFDPLGYIAFLMIGSQLALNIINININNNNDNNNNNNDNNNNNNDNMNGRAFHRLPDEEFKYEGITVSKDFAYPNKTSVGSNNDLTMTSQDDIASKISPKCECKKNKENGKRKKKGEHSLKKYLLGYLFQSKKSPNCMTMLGCVATAAAKRQFLVTLRRMAEKTLTLTPSDRLLEDLYPKIQDCANISHQCSIDLG